MGRKDKRGIVWLHGIGGLMVCMLLFLLDCTARAEGFYENSYIHFTPDHGAWTVEEALPQSGDANNKINPTCWYPYGETIVTGMEGSTAEPGIGEHEYRYERKGMVPIQKWVVAQPVGKCIHNNANQFHGLSVVTSKCGSNYYSGWNGYCADCGEKVIDFYIYMSREKLAGITQIDTNLDYYYLCPTCGHLEQGRSVHHACKAVSANRYRVRYLPNGGNVAGVMQSSFHMYDNAELFEGEPVTPIKMLSINSYTRVGYIFDGWNTEPDGSGEAFRDGQEILNLTDENYDPSEDAGTVILYAQWKKAEGILEVDPAGGKYQGHSDPVKISVGYGEEYELRTADLVPPEGYLVQFEVNGGEPLESMRGTKALKGWKLLTPACGVLEGERYCFWGKDGQTDCVLALYCSQEIILPLPRREGYGFGGWYYDAEYKKLAGNAGDPFTPQKDQILYANWVELVLSARLNLKAHGGKGAVDLSWWQADGNQKTYLIYQKREGEEYVQVYDADETEITGDCEVYENVENQSTYTVKYSGFYRLVAYGAQGQGYEGYEGGRGGSCEGVFYLTEGDELRISVGSCLEDGDGGKASKYGNGGGRTMIVSAKEGVLLVAGGGGGALPVSDGGEGGMENALREDGLAEGQDGMAGGGAGWIGGGAGLYEPHVHTEECVHVHLGNAITGGDCYQEEIEEETCHVVVSGPHVDWGRKDNCDDCIRAGRNGFGTMHPRIWRIEHFGCGQETDNGSAGWWQCEICGRIGYRWGSGMSKPTASDHNYLLKHYVLVCTKEYDCGNPPGRMTKSSGGSNHVNEALARSFSSMPGVRTGDGMAVVEAQCIGFNELNALEGVFAPDLECPDAVDAQHVQVEEADEGMLRVLFEKPADHGTDYYHQVHSYLKGEEEVLSRSNVTSTEVITGIAGYYYLLDGKTETSITVDNRGQATFTGKEEIYIPAPEANAYLHIAPMDVAGNMGETTTIMINAYLKKIPWKIYTKELLISSVIAGMEYGSVADAEGCDKGYYVRADGRTPFLLDFSGVLNGNAREDYQINRMTFDYTLQGSEVSGGFTANIPMTELGNAMVSYNGESIGRQTYGTGLLQAGMYTNASRMDLMREVRIEQSFCMESVYDGKMLRVIPVAGTYWQGKNYLSDRSIDEEHGIWLIGDGKAPEIIGLQECESVLLSERNEDAILVLSAEDAGSGVAVFEAILCNLDNGDEEIYFPESDGKIRIHLDTEDELFIGDLQLRVRATDRVGNVNQVCCGAQDFGLRTEVLRILAPHDPIFKRGESGVLRIRARGYVERIEVQFPDEFSSADDSLNRVFLYDEPKGVAMEEIEFMVPLTEIEDRDYEITVKAFKNEGELEDRPALSTIRVDGSVLGEIRTRLR